MLHWGGLRSTNAWGSALQQSGGHTMRQHGETLPPSSTSVIELVPAACLPRELTCMSCTPAYRKSGGEEPAKGCCLCLQLFEVLFLFFFSRMYVFLHSTIHVQQHQIVTVPDFGLEGAGMILAEITSTYILYEYLVVFFYFFLKLCT